MQFRFRDNFANNWEAGQVVPCEEKEDGYLVDRVAFIDKNELLKHGEFIADGAEESGVY